MGLVRDLEQPVEQQLMGHFWGTLGANLGQFQGNSIRNMNNLEA